MTSPSAARQLEAIDEMIAAYVAAFGEQPDNVTGMVISASAERVADGEPFRWVQDGQWRKMEFRWEGFEDSGVESDGNEGDEQNVDSFRIVKTSYDFPLVVCSNVHPCFFNAFCTELTPLLPVRDTSLNASESTGNKNRSTSASAVDSLQ